MRYITWGMKARVLSLIVVPTMLVLLMFALFIHRDMQSMQKDFNENGYLIANQIAIASEYGALTENMDTLKDAVRSVIEIADVEGVVILNSDQKAYIEQGNIQVTKNIPNEFKETYECHKEDAFSIFCAPILYTQFQVNDFEDDSALDNNKVFIGSIQVSISTRALSQKITELITYAIAFIVFTLISTLLMARRIEGQIIEPILELTGVVKEIGGGQLDQRATLKSSGEIKLLQDGINLMATALNDYHTDMQSKISNATEVLRGAMNEIEIKNSELEIERNRAEEASQAKSLFLAAMSHEIRTPLSGMLGMLDLIGQSNLSPLQGDQIHNIKQASTSLKSLIDDILDSSRIDAGKLNIVNNPFSISELVDDVVTMLAPSAQTKGLELLVNIDLSLPEKVVGDSLRTRQVLINILSNAIKFTEEGEVAFRIRRSQVDDAPNMVSVCFEIEDSGIGIAPEQQNDVFERFSQVDQGRERHYEGSGLGATTAKQLVELMEGDIHLSSEVGKGSCFNIDLTWPIFIASSIFESISPQLKGEKVLVLDGHREAGRVLQRYLEASGAQVILIQSTTELPHYLIANHFERVVICDEFDNESTHKQLQQMLVQQNQGCSLVGIISSFTDNHEEQVPEFEYDFRWVKPITPNRLHSFIKRSKQALSQDENIAEKSKLSLLVAEDDEINAKVIIFLLEKRGHHVTRVANGEDALHELKGSRFDAVFMDVRMPNMSGIDATKAWREYEQKSKQHTPIIALTANDSEKELCMQVGMDGFILKPISNEALDQLEPIIPGLCRTVS